MSFLLPPEDQQIETGVQGIHNSHSDAGERGDVIFCWTTWPTLFWSIQGLEIEALYMHRLTSFQAPLLRAGIKHVKVDNWRVPVSIFRGSHIS